MSKIKHKRGTGDPSASDLDVGELGINTTDGGVFTKTDGGSVVEVGSGGGGGLESDAKQNTLAGTSAGSSVSTSAIGYNSFFGYHAGKDYAGTRSTAVGHGALKTNYNGLNNTAIGATALTLATGSQNTAVGANVALSTTSGSRNTFIGAAVGYFNTTGSDLVGVGYQTLFNNTTGTHNVAVGREAGKQITTGTYNTLIGNWAGNSGTNDLTTGSNNILIGKNASASAATVSNEVTIGDTNITKFRVPGLNFTVKDSTATEGHVLTVDANGEAGFAAASGGGGVTVQEEGSSLSTSGSTLNFVGNLITASGSGDTKTITVAGDWDVSQATTNNNQATVAGYLAGNALTDGSTDSVDHGSYVTLYGHRAGQSITSAHNVTAIGYCLKSLTTGTGNSGLGAYSLTSCTTGGYNTGIGTGALSQGTTASRNVGLGHQAGAAITTGSNNIFLGERAGFTETSTDITTGSNNILIGRQAIASSATVSNEITLGNSSTATIRSNTQTISSLSDRRDKTDINILDLGLNFVKSLNPVKFKWETRDGNGKDGSYEAGFIAQDFQQIQKENDADYLGLVMDQNPDRLEASYGKLVPILVKAIQELTIEVEKLKSNG